MTVEITRSQAIAIMSGLGRKNADSWRRNQMQTTLESLHETVTDSDTIGDRDLDNLLDDLIAAGSSGEPIVIVPEERLVTKEEDEEGEEEGELDMSEEDGDAESGPGEESEEAEEEVEDLGEEDPDEDSEEPDDEEDLPEEDLGEDEEDEEIVPRKKPGRKPAAKTKDDKPKPKTTTSEKTEARPVRRPYRKKNGLQNVRHTKGRPYLAGMILARYGLDKGITDEMIDDLNKRCTPRNRSESLSRLKMAWHVVSGYLESLKK